MEELKLSQLFLIITDNCNLACKHCCFSCNPSKENYLDKNTVFSIIDSALDLGYDIIDFSGGEPTSHPDFPEILDYAVKSKFRLIAIASNLFKIEDLADLFDSIKQEDKDRLVFRIGIDGPNSKIHDELRGKGAFEHTLKGVHFLRQKGIKLQSANTLITLNNYPHIKEIVEFVDKEGFINNNWIAIFPYGNGNNYSKFQLDTEIWFNDLYSKCINYSKTYSTVFTYCGPFVDEKCNKYSLFELAKNSSNGLVVNEKGDIFAGCIVNMYTESPISNIFVDSFEECHIKVNRYFNSVTCKDCTSRFPCKGTFIYKNQPSINSILT